MSLFPVLQADQQGQHGGDVGPGQGQEDCLSICDLPEPPRFIGGYLRCGVQKGDAGGNKSDSVILPNIIVIR